MLISYDKAQSNHHLKATLLLLMLITMMMMILGLLFTETGMNAVPVTVSLLLSAFLAHLSQSTYLFRLLTVYEVGYSFIHLFGIKVQIRSLIRVTKLA